MMVACLIKNCRYAKKMSPCKNNVAMLKKREAKILILALMFVLCWCGTSVMSTEYDYMVPNANTRAFVKD